MNRYGRMSRSEYFWKLANTNTREGKDALVAAYPEYMTPVEELLWGDTVDTYEDRRVVARAMNYPWAEVAELAGADHCQWVGEADPTN